MVVAISLISTSIILSISSICLLGMYLQHRRYEFDAEISMRQRGISAAEDYLNKQKPGVYDFSGVSTAGERRAS